MAGEPPGGGTSPAPPDAATHERIRDGRSTGAEPTALRRSAERPSESRAQMRTIALIMAGMIAGLLAPVIAEGRTRKKHA